MSASAAIGALLLAVAVALTAIPAASAPASHSTTAGEKLGSSLASLAADRPAHQVKVIVRMAPDATTGKGRSLVRQLGGKPTSRDLSIINGFGAELRARDAARLSRDPSVEAVSLNGSVSTRGYVDGLPGGRVQNPEGCPNADATTMSLSRWPISRNNYLTEVTSSLSRLRNQQQAAVGADRAWGERATGKGVGVAVIDTGIAGDLPDFRRSADSTSSRVVASAVTNPCAVEATDNYGHGTHVAGLIAGNSTNLSPDDPSFGRYMGIAPNADLISVKVADEDGNSTVLDVIYGLQFVVEHKDELNIRVANLSLTSTSAESYRTDPLDAAVEQAWAHGVVVVTAAGNEGNSSDAVDFAPANDPYVISVGAVDDRGTRSIADDTLAPWSSRGVTADGVKKPEVLAPGARLTATLAPFSDFGHQCYTCITSYRYFKVGGTSMSSAVVSGAVALVLEKHPDWTPNQVKGALQSTLQDVPGAGGMVNAYAAMHAGDLTANAGLTASDLIDPASGDIDWTRASFRRASFRDATDSSLEAQWSRASFRCSCSLTDSGAVDPARASFRRSSFRRTAEFDK